MVGYSGREIRAVAPNSPIEMVNANVAATSTALPTSGRSTWRSTWCGAAPNTSAASRKRGRMLRRAGVRLRTTQGKDEAQPQGDRGGAQGQHHERVEPAVQRLGCALAAFGGPGKRPRGWQAQSQRQGDGGKGISHRYADR